MLRLALKMLFGDTAKYLMLVAGLAVATFLMAQQTAVFCGLMNWTKSTLKNVPAPIWVVEDKVEQVNETNPLLDTDVARVRSVKSVAWASPIYSGIQRVRLENGNFKMIQLIGIDSNTLAGAPAKMLEGDLMKLRLPHSVIIDDLGVTRLARKRGEKVKVGDVFELNDQEARVVGIADAVTSFTGGPYVWTTYERALQYVPPQRKMLQAVICAPREGVSLEQAVEDIRRTTGLKAFINREADFSEFWAQRGGGETNNFNVSTVWWYVKNTGIPISFGTTVIIGLLVGMAVSCQTFYSFCAGKHAPPRRAEGHGSLQWHAVPHVDHAGIYRRHHRLRHRPLLHIRLRDGCAEKRAASVLHAGVCAICGAGCGPRHLRPGSAAGHLASEQTGAGDGVPELSLPPYSNCSLASEP